MRTIIILVFFSLFTAFTSNAKPWIDMDARMLSGTDLEAANAGLQNANTARSEANAFQADAIFKGKAGTLVAQGDSWFDYPFYNVLKYLKWKHDFKIESIAENGEWLETMAYDENKLKELALTVRELRDQGIKPRGILLSGGGNDISGLQLTVLLNHRNSNQAPIDETVLDDFFSVRLRRDMIALISVATQLSYDYFNEPIPIFIHGYAYPVPDGRGYLGTSLLSGPWLKPSFNKKGYDIETDEAELATEIMARLVDKYNQVLQEISDLPAMAHVHYVDLRDLLSNSQGTYKDDWGNELHPTMSGFEKIADEFAAIIGETP
jgi:lysophospholipase L1-like esterase